MEHTWNINGFGEEIEALLKRYRQNPADRETIKAGLKNLCVRNGITDPKYKLYKLSKSDGLAELSGESLEEFLNNCADNVFRSNERDRVIDNESKDLRDPEKKPKKVIYFDLNEFKNDNSKVKIKARLLNKLSELGIDPYEPIKEATISNIEIPGTSIESNNQNLIDWLVDLVYKLKQSSLSLDQSLGEKSPELKEEKLTNKEQSEPKTDEESSQSSNPVMADRPQIEDEKIKGRFDELCNEAENLIENMIWGQGPKENCESFVEIFISNFKSFENLCQQNYGMNDVKKALNFSKGVVHYVLCIYKDLDHIRDKGLTLHTVNNVYIQRHGPIDSNDADGLSRTSPHHKHAKHEHVEELDTQIDIDSETSSPEEYSDLFNSTGEEINEMFTTFVSMSDPLTPEDLEDMRKYGFSPEEFPTHSEYAEFKLDPEYQMHASRGLEYGPNNKPNN